MKHKILIIDNEGFHGLTCCNILQSYGHDAHYFLSCEEGLRVYQATPGYDRILVSAEMPYGMSGCQFIWQIRNVLMDMRVHICLMCESMGPELEKHAKAVGANCVLKIPIVNRQDLLNSLEVRKHYPAPAAP